MPIFEYTCPDCGNEQENLVRSGDAEPSCASCGGNRLRRKLSLFAVNSGAPPATGCACAAEGSCPGPSRASGCGHGGACGCGG